MRRETNAERLARLAEAPDKNEESLHTALVNLYADDARNSRNAAQVIIDVLASWRTCGTCRWFKPWEERCPDVGSICGNLASMYSCKEVSQDEDTCGHWEEVGQ